MSDALVPPHVEISRGTAERLVRGLAAMHSAWEGFPLEGAARPTLLHPDAKLENLGLDDSRLVAIDWGELAGTGPAETDIAWLAVQSTWRIDVSPNELFRLYDEHAGRRLDPRTLDLACVGACTQMGFKLALRSVRGSDDGVRARARTLLAWWVSRVSGALDRTSVL